MSGIVASPELIASGGAGSGSVSPLSSTDARVQELMEELVQVKGEKELSDITVEEQEEEVKSLRQRSDRMQTEIHALKHAARMLCEQLMVAKREAGGQSPLSATRHDEARKKDTDLLREALESLRAVSLRSDRFEKEVCAFSPTLCCLPHASFRCFFLDMGVLGVLV